MKKTILLFTFLFGITSIQKAQLSSGPFTVSTAVDDAVGTNTWSTPTSGNMAIIAPLLTGQTSNGLKLTNFGFNIPTAANIVGVEAIITFSCPTGPAKDSVVRLLKNNVLTGNNLGNVHTFTQVVTTYTYGASNNLWGTTLTPADVNSPNFGVSVRLKNVHTTQIYVSMERSMQQLTKMKVYYESTVGIIESQTSFAQGYSFNKTLYINGVYEDSKMEIFTITGQKVYETIVNPNQTQIDLGNLNTGIYFYKMMVGKKEVSSKFVIE